MKSKDILFVETLLKNYKSMKAKRFNLNIKWGMLERQKNSAIAGQYLAAAAYDGMPGTPRDGYKEPRLMTTRCSEVEALENEQSFIIDQVKDLDDTITILDQSLNSLTPFDMHIVVSFYIDGLSIQKIANKVWLHPSRVFFHKKQSLEQLYKSLSCLRETAIFK